MIPGQLITKVTLNEKIVLFFNAGTISLDYIASNSTVFQSRKPRDKYPEPALTLERGDVRIWILCNWSQKPCHEKTKV